MITATFVVATLATMARDSTRIPPTFGRAATVVADSEPKSPRAVQPERPTVATHAGTVAPRYWEVESGVEQDRINAHASATLVPTVLKFGIAPRVQLSVLAPLEREPDASFGLGDLAVGVKWRLLEGAPLVHDLAVLPQVKFPTGGDRGTHTTDASLLLISSRSLGGVDLDANAGFTWRSGDGSDAPRSASLLTLSAAIPVHGPLGAAVECYGYPGTSGPAGSPPIVALLAGPTWNVATSLALDAGVIIPLDGPQPHAFYAGLVANLGRFLPTPRLHGVRR